MKLTELEKLDGILHDGMTVMIGGFMGVGTPETVIDFMVSKNYKNLTLICTDTARPDTGIGKLIVNGQVKKLYASHIGTNAETGKQMIAGDIDVTLVPQGTLAEKIRCGGAGLGGVLTKTGLGTLVAEGKEVITVNGEEYLLETPLRADVAIVAASVSDEKGNLIYRGATRNFNPMMAMAADKVIAEAKEIVKCSEMDSNNVMTPHIIVDYIVKGE